MQEHWAKASFVGPANKKVQLDAELGSMVPYGPAAVGKLMPLDGGAIGRALQNYRDQWNAKIASK